MLEQAEGQAKFCQGIKADIPQYIINKLGLNRDPMAGKLNPYILLFQPINSVNLQRKSLEEAKSAFRTLGGIVNVVTLFKNT